MNSVSHVDDSLFESSPERGSGGEDGLILRAKAGDLVAYESLVRANVQRLRAYLALRAPAGQLVDDLAQEAFIVAFQKIDKLRDGTPFLAWVRGIAFQLLRRERKRFQLDSKNRERLIDHVSILQSLGTSEPQLDERVERLEFCLRKVADKMRKLLDLRYRDGMSSSEIAGKVEQSDDWVRTNLSRTRKQLRLCIERGSQNEGGNQS